MICSWSTLMLALVSNIMIGFTGKKFSIHKQMMQKKDLN